LAPRERKQNGETKFDFYDAGNSTPTDLLLYGTLRTNFTIRGIRKKERKESFWSFLNIFIILCDKNGFDTIHIISEEKRERERESEKEREREREEEKMYSSSFNKKKEMARTEKIGLIKTKKRRKKKKKFFNLNFLWKWKFYTFIKIYDIHSFSATRIANFQFFLISNFFCSNLAFKILLL